MPRIQFFIFLFSVFVLSCTGIDSFDNADNINYEAEFAIPLFDSKVSVADLVESASENTSVRVESDGSVTVLFSGDLIRKSAEEIVPPVPGIGDLQLFDTVFQAPFVFNDFIIKNAKINGDVIHFRFRSDLTENISVRVWIPQLTKNGLPYEENFDILYQGELPVNLTTEDVSLAGYELVSDDNTITYHYDARNENGERIQLDKAWVNVNFLTFEYVEGFFGKSTFDIQGDIITIGIFDKWVAGTLEFDDPKVTVRVDNAFGFPVRSQVNELTITTFTGQVLPLEADVVQEGVNFDFPSLDEVGQTVSTKYIFDKDNSNIKELFNEKATKLTYDIDALANPENDPSIIGFTTDSSFFLINLAVELPMKGKADDFTIIDTLISDLNLADEFVEAEFKLISQNHFPVDMTLQLELYSESGELLDKMFDQPFLMEAANLLPDGSTNALPEKITFINYDEERLSKVRQARKMVLKANMTSINGAIESVTILDEFTVDTRMGVKVKIVD
jgi:FKBP-type peptidyl-prolyl cis-trans isomerase 2